MRCPACRSDLVRRTSRHGVGERLLSIAYVYPFRCQLCQHRFLRLRWGERYVRAGIDRREFDRHRVDFWSEIWAQGGQQPGRVRDLSANGASIETDVPLRPGDVLKLRLQPGDDQPDITVEVAIVRSVQTGKVGIQFVKTEGEQQERLRRVIQDLSLPDPDPR